MNPPNSRHPAARAGSKGSTNSAKRLTREADRLWMHLRCLAAVKAAPPLYTWGYDNRSSGSLWRCGLARLSLFVITSGQGGDSSVPKKRMEIPVIRVGEVLAEVHTLIPTLGSVLRA